MSTTEMYGPERSGESTYWEEERMRREEENRRRKALSPDERAAENAARAAERAAKRAANEQRNKNEENEKIIPQLKELEKSRHTHFKYIENYNEGAHDWTFFINPPTAQYRFQIITLSDLITHYKNNVTIKMVTKSGWFPSKKIIITRVSDGKKLAFKSLRGDDKLKELYTALMDMGLKEETSGGYKSRRNRHKKRRVTRRTKSTK